MRIVLESGIGILWIRVSKIEVTLCESHWLNKCSHYCTKVGILHKVRVIYIFQRIIHRLNWTE